MTCNICPDECTGDHQSDDAPTCRTCENGTPDAPAITTDSYVVPGTNGHVLVEQVCQDCAARATGTIDYVEVAPWMDDEEFKTEPTIPMPTLTDVELRRLQLKEVA